MFRVRRSEFLLREAQLPAERLDAGITSEADLREVETGRGANGIDRRQPLESFQRAIPVAQESIDLGLPLWKVPELRGNRFGFCAPAVDRMDIASYTQTASRELLEHVQRFSPFARIAGEEQRPPQVARG